MSLPRWDQRFRDQDAPGAPYPLVIETTKLLPPGRALDLACGLGRNAIYLAGTGWDVTGVDGSEAAIANLRHINPTIQARIADLERGQFIIRPGEWDLILSCLYFQNDIFASIKQGLKPGGIAIAAALMAEQGKENSPYRVKPGQLETCFRGYDILHCAEIRHPTHSIAEVVARKPAQSE